MKPLKSQIKTDVIKDVKNTTDNKLNSNSVKNQTSQDSKLNTNMLKNLIAHKLINSNQHT